MTVFRCPRAFETISSGTPCRRRYFLLVSRQYQWVTNWTKTSGAHVFKWEAQLGADPPTVFPVKKKSRLPFPRVTGCWVVWVVVGAIERPYRPKEKIGQR